MDSLVKQAVGRWLELGVKGLAPESDRLLRGMQAQMDKGQREQFKREIRTIRREEARETGATPNKEN